MPRVQATDEARSYGRRASLLSIGVGLTGLITYLYFAIASHELSREQYGQIAVLWSAVFIVVSILQRPVEQLLSRTVSENLAHGTSIGHTVRVAATIQLGVAVGFDVIALALRTPIQDDLLHGNSTLYWIGVAAVTAYGVSYFARGFLAGSHRLTIYALQIISESIARTAFPTAVALGIASGQTAVALGIVAAPTLSLIGVPFAFLRRFGTAEARVADTAEAPAAPPPTPTRTEEFTLAHGGRFAAAVFLIMLSEQTFLNAGPLLVKATGGSEGAALAGFVFNVLLIARAPLQLFQAVQTSILPHLTRLRASGETDPFRRSVNLTLRAIAAFAACVALVMFAIGPWLMDVVFGGDFDYERGGLVLVSIGMGLYLAAATLNQALLAHGRAPHAAVAWVGCAVAFALFLLIADFDNRVLQVEIAFLGAAGALCALLHSLYRRA
jgi:O-antigen/teichoic acid export membrane protein